jgi:hypothetical protein
MTRCGWSGGGTMSRSPSRSANFTFRRDPIRRGTGCGHAWMRLPGRQQMQGAVAGDGAERVGWL